MATSSAIIHSFINDQLTQNKTVAQLQGKDFVTLRDELLEYSRAECGLIELDFDPSKKFAAIEQFISDKDLPNYKHMVVLHDHKLFHVDRNSRKVSEIKKDDSDGEEFDQLKRACTSSYQKAKGSTLDLVRSLTHRAFNQHRSDDFISSLNYYLGQLGKIDKVMFAFMSKERKDQLQFELKTTLLLLLAQQKHEIDYQKTENRNVYAQDIKRCVEFLDALDPEFLNFIKNSPEQAEISKDKPAKYLGIEVGLMLGQEILDWTETKTEKGTTKTIKDYMGSLNVIRLNWVWESSFLKTVIELIPKDHPNADQAATAIRYPDLYTGTLSWTLYYARFALNLSLLLKHTIKGDWMSAEESKMPWYERFQTQWDQRKFTLLNDSLWATANLVCFFWLNGKSILSTWGDAVTVALLIVDISIAVWEFEEQKTKYNKAMLYYRDDIARIEKRLKSLNDAKKEGESECTAEEKQLRMQLKALKKEQKQCEQDWQKDQRLLMANIAYAVGLMLAFVVLTMPFLPVSAPVVATLGLVGAVLCLAFTVINNAIKGSIELHTTHQTRKEIQGKMSSLEDKWLNLTDENEKIFLFLKIKKLEAETDYQRQMMIYQSVSLVRTIALDILIPAVVFLSIVCMPLGFGLLTLGAALGLALGTGFLVELCKPEEKKALEFKKEEYKSHPFFKAESNKKIKEELLREDDFVDQRSGTANLGLSQQRHILHPIKF